MCPQSAERLRYEEVRFRDIPALFTSLRVSKENMPEGIYRYELRHDDESYTPCQLAKHIVINHYGTILTSTPVQLPADGYLDFEPDDLAFMPRSCVTIAEFLQSYPPANKVAIELFPMKPEEAPLFFSSLDESEDKARGCIGHVGGDFDGALYTTWWPHYHCEILPFYILLCQQHFSAAVDRLSIDKLCEVPGLLFVIFKAVTAIDPAIVRKIDIPFHDGSPISSPEPPSGDHPVLQSEISPEAPVKDKLPSGFRVNFPAPVLNQV